MPLRMRSPLPSLAGVSVWINGPEPSAEVLAGRPVFVSFWSISCYLCHETAEQVGAWRERFAPAGFVFVSVHQPRSEAELDAGAVREDARSEMKLVQPVAVDNEHTLADRFQNQFVPSYYVFDRNHQLRHFQAGDKGYERIEAALDRVAKEDLGEVPA